MKRHFVFLLGFVLGLSVLAMGAGTETCIIKGTVLDSQGKPVAGAVIELTGIGTGTHYSTKTDKKGFYIQVGVKAGTYRVDVSKDNQVLWTIPEYEVHFGAVMMVMQQDASYTNTLNITIGQATGAGSGGGPAVPLSPAEQQALQELQQQAAAAPKKDAKLVDEINQKILAAQSAERQGNSDLVISTLTEVTRMDPRNDGAWAGIGLVYLKTGKPDLAVAAYLKAVALKPDFSPYHQNLAVAYSKTGHIEDAISEFQSAALADAAHAGNYFLYAGMLLSNNNRTAPALEMLEKAIAADPTLADAYYFKGVDLMRQAQWVSGKLVPPAGTAEAFQKYLALQPSGSHSADAKSQLALIGG